MVVLDGTIVNIALPSMGALLRQQPDRHDVGAQRLHPRLRRPAAARWTRGRHPRPAADVHHRPRPVHPRQLRSAASRRTSSCCWPGASIQGVGGAIASPTALSLITTAFDEGEERNRALGVYAAVSGAGCGARPAARRHPHRLPRAGAGCCSSTSRSASCSIVGAFLYLHQQRAAARAGSTSSVRCSRSPAWSPLVYGFIHVAHERLEQRRRRICRVRRGGRPARRRSCSTRRKAPPTR